MKSFVKSSLLLLCFALILSSCGKSSLPPTLGDQNTIYSYVPLDPLPVFEEGGRSCEGRSAPAKYKKLLESLPDQAVRLAITQTNAKVTGSFSAVAVGIEGNSYQVILDYISVDAAQLPVYVKRWKVDKNGQRGAAVPLYSSESKDSIQYSIKGAPRINPYDPDVSNRKLQKNESDGELVVVPVYVGVGLRLTASIVVLKGSVSLSSLGAISAAAEAGKITGTLTVQTLGITGKSVATTLPLPSEINPTTIQNSILALGSIKAILHDETSAIVEPRVVGFYNPLGSNQQITNGIVSCLAENPITWYRPCKDLN